MNLLILGKKLGSSRTNYLGTYRDSPSFHEDLSEHHPVNQLFLKYLASTDEHFVLHDEQLAQALVTEFNNLLNNQYELVEVSFEKFTDNKDKLLGYDISTGFYSLLSWGLEFDRDEKEADEQTELGIAKPILRLIEAYFYPKLNKFGLFSTYEDADFCLKCLYTIQKCFPNLLENNEVIFRVIGIRRY